MPDLIPNALRLQPGVVYDGVPLGKDYGDVKEDVPEDLTVIPGQGGPYGRGNVLKAVFWAGHPRNDLMTEGMRRS